MMLLSEASCVEINRNETVSLKKMVHRIIFAELLLRELSKEANDYDIKAFYLEIQLFYEASLKNIHEVQR